MRGLILDFNEQSGDGLISGADGVRYTFARRDLARDGRLAHGQQVDFIIDGGIPTELVVLEYESRRDDQLPSSQNVPESAPRHDPWGYFIRCCSTAYFQGDGRAGPGEYWWFVLFHLLTYVVLAGALVAVGATAFASGAAGTSTPEFDGYDVAILGLALLIILAGLFFIIPGITVLIRRLHDIGQSGLWVLLALVPLGGLALIVMCCMASQPGPNQYGLPPR